MKDDFIYNLLAMIIRLKDRQALTEQYKILYGI